MLTSTYCLNIRKTKIKTKFHSLQKFKMHKFMPSNESAIFNDKKTDVNSEQFHLEVLHQDFIHIHFQQTGSKHTSRLTQQ